MAAVLLLLLLAGCGGSSAARSRFDFEHSDYPGIVVVPLKAMLEGRMTADFDERAGWIGIENAVREAATTALDRPFMMDWDTILGLASNQTGDHRDVVRYYLAYEVVHDPTAGSCTMLVHVIEGLPFDPNRMPVQTFMATVNLGEMHRAGFTITTPGECADEAGHRAGEAIAASDFFQPGWSMGPPDHMGV